LEVNWRSDIIFEDNDIFGDGVNVAARLEGVSEPGGLCISDDAQRQVRAKVDVTFGDMMPEQTSEMGHGLPSRMG
jgi:adenylate cyclase